MEMVLGRLRVRTDAGDDDGLEMLEGELMTRANKQAMFLWKTQRVGM